MKATGIVRRIDDLGRVVIPKEIRRTMRIREGDQLIEAKLTSGEAEVMIAAREGKAIRFNERTVRPIGRVGAGVRGISLEEGDEAVGMICVEPDSGQDVLVLSENGYGKRTDLDEYRITNRGGLGIKNYMVTEKTGGIVGVKVVDGSEDLLLVTRAGILIRTPVEAIRTTGRATQGVIVMRFKEEGDSVISMALTEHEEDDEA